MGGGLGLRAYMHGEAAHRTGQGQRGNAAAVGSGVKEKYSAEVHAVGCWLL